MDKGKEGCPGPTRGSHLLQLMYVVHPPHSCESSQAAHDDRHSHVSNAIHTANYETATECMYLREPLGEETVTVDLNKLCVLVAIL